MFEFDQFTSSTLDNLILRTTTVCENSVEIKTITFLWDHQ